MVMPACTRLHAHHVRQRVARRRLRSVLGHKALRTVRQRVRSPVLCGCASGFPHLVCACVAYHMGQAACVKLHFLNDKHHVAALCTPGSRWMPRMSMYTTDPFGMRQSPISMSSAHSRLVIQPGGLSRSASCSEACNAMHHGKWW